MSKHNVAIAAVAILAAVATATGINTQQQRGHRGLYNNDGGGWSSTEIGWNSGSSGKSGKSGSGSSGSSDTWGSSSGGWYSGSSGKSGKSGSSGSSSSSGSWSDSSSHDSWSSSSSSSSSSSWSSSGKSGKSGSGGKSGKSGSGGWSSSSSSSSSSSWSSSGKSGKSGSGGKSGKSGSGGWSSSSSSSSSSSWSSSGKSGKSGSGGKSGKSGSGGWSSSSSSWSSSGKSGKSGSGGGWYIWEEAKSGKSKSGKTKSGKTKSGKAKSGKSKSSKGAWVWVPAPPTPAPQPDPTKKPTPKPTVRPVAPPTMKPTKTPTKKPVAPPAPKPVPVPNPSLNTICFKKGEQIPCSGSPSGDGIVSSFSYTVETKPGYSTDQVMIPLENAILSDVAAQVVGSGFTGSISAKPLDEINEAKECSHEGKADCAYVDGAMTFYFDGHDGSDNDGGAYVGTGSSSSGSGNDGAAYGRPSSGSDGGNGSGSGSSHSDSDSLNAHQVIGSDGGSGLDACGGATLIHESMQGNDYSSVNGVKNVEFKEKTSCPAIVANKTIVAEEEEDNTAVIVGVPLAAALLVALALLVARRRRDDREEFSLASDLDDFMGPPEDPYANTIDVHKCTSMYCDCCNKGLEHVSFIPAPMKVDLNQTRAAAGLPPMAPNTPVEDLWQYPDYAQDADSDTVTAVQNGSTNGQEAPAPETYVPVTETPDDARSYLPVEQRPLTTVNEIAHDSEIDTELESVAGDDDASIPPPPPRQPPDDEMSI